MSVFVKICGVRNEREARAVAGLEPDAMGFIFWPESRRFVEPGEVGSWKLPSSVAKVGVFVDASPRDVAAAVDAAGLDVVQLHGREAPGDYAGIVADRWKAVHMVGTDVHEARGMDVDAFLVDSRSEEMPGGTGKVCDWDAAARFVDDVDAHVLLAGGLTPANVERALDRVAPWGVDVSTGVEGANGNKDLDLVQEFIERCRKR